MMSLNILEIAILKLPDLCNYTKTLSFHIQDPGTLSLLIATAVEKNKWK